MPKEKVVIIGAGIAGLAAAARLAAKGMQVSVYEKNAHAGGKMGLLKTQGYTFDTGPSLFTQPYLLEELFSACGKQLSGYLQYEPLAINTNYFYEDGTCLTAYNDHELLAKEIEEKLHVKPDNVLKHLSEMKRLYHHIGTLFLDKPLHKLSTWLSRRLPTALAALKSAYLLQSMHQYHTRVLKHPKLVQLFDRFATYNGSNPYQAPAMLCMIAHLEMNEGAYYPKGGMISIPEAVFRLCKDLGVQFYFNTAVEKIVIDKNKTAGIIANRQLISADRVISNSDIYFTYKNLLADVRAAKKLRQQQRSSSAVIFYWGIRKQFPQLDLHNILFTENYKEEFDAIFNKKTIYADPTVYINITSKKEAALAPAGCENWFVLINTPPGIGDAAVAAVRNAVIKKINRMLDTDISSLIHTERILTPSMIERQTGSYLGALYGISSNSPMAAFVRHGNVSKKYKALYFTGGTVHPGGGIPLCLRSAKLLSEAME